MRRVGTVVMIAAASALALVGGAAAAGAQAPIQPHQHFGGLVNGSHDDPVVYTVCPGPASLDRTGSVAGGQTLAVAKVAKGAGYTGPFSQVYAWFEQDSSAGGPQQVKFTTYGTPLPVPSDVRVPCDGDGQVEFSSCPHLAPCAYGWVPDIVNVPFLNIT